MSSETKKARTRRKTVSFSKDTKNEDDDEYKNVNLKNDAIDEFSYSALPKRLNELGADFGTRRTISECTAEKEEEDEDDFSLNRILSTKTLAPSKSFQDALLAIMAENPESPKKFDEIEWDEYGSGLIQAKKEPTSFLVKNRRTSVDDNVIGLRLGPRRRRGGIISEESQKAALEKNGEEKGAKPNVVFIMADDLGYKDVGYNSLEAFTPNINHLAKNGIILDSHYSQPVCSPSRSQFLTGRYSFRYGMQHRNILPTQPHGVPLTEKMLPEFFKECGYSALGVGKWHQGMFHQDFLPTSRGFDKFVGSYSGSSQHVTHEKCFDSPQKDAPFSFCGYDMREAERIKDITTGKDDNREIMRFDLNGTHSNKIVTDEIEKTLAAKKNSNEPLFIFAAFQAVHGPLTTEPEDERIYENLFERNRNETIFKRTKMLAMEEDEEEEEVRDEIVHHLDPLKKLDDEIEDPRPFVKVYGFDYDIRMKTAIRVGKYKLITGAEATKSPLENQAELDALSKSQLFVGNPWLKKKQYRKLVVLYDIEKDPRELNDISDQDPEMVVHLLSRLVRHFNSATAPNFPSLDKSADPNLRNGTWGPWISDLSKVDSKSIDFSLVYNSNFYYHATK
ncbi:Oidioi.mRNA.OKI2018_I69.chr1.g1336.t1.cds [Oikopleura dioica]|uniref:Oidioi.mRNA.OKI2018_I69.chr1.g1336.t1.cds n=1 Tax=Oikopleura dioica TaxID=34765 RepID=A0ABN7SMK8_OIKDI|nr:Oidioi.mRNA.OKI2018_I69.chr1.g1336.t1.cds [Oikopleura dioica]